MNRLRTIAVVLLVIASTATAGELTTLEGKKLTGEIAAINGNELTFRTTDGKDEKLLVTAINAVTMGPAPAKISAGKKYTFVELVDGSSFRCESIMIRGKNVEMTLLGASPKKIEIPMRPAVYSINREAGDLKLEQDFRVEVGRRERFDRWLQKRQTKNDLGKEVDRLDGISGTFGDGDQAGSTINFVFSSNAKQSAIRMTQVAGIIFSQPPGAAAPAICKVIDTDGNEYVVQSVTRSPAGFALVTVSGVKVELAAKDISKFDFAAGSVKYLSDLEPVALEESGTDPERYQRDRNLDRRPIELFVDPDKGLKQMFPKGISMHAKTVITYELKGQYKSFRALAGVDADAENEAPSSVRITIDDGTQVLFKGVVKKGSKPVDLNLAIQGVERLKITVDSENPGLDLGNQISLANARVLK